VAAIVAVGKWADMTYMIEDSLGSRTLGDRFDDELEREGVIRDDTFAEFLDVVRRHASAQAAMATGAADAESFARLLGVSEAAANVADLGGLVPEVFERAFAKLAGLPAVWVHVDLHEHNMCRHGVIDLEGTAWGVAGYDVVTAVFVAALTDVGPPAGAPSAQRFSESQVDAYLAMVDEVFEASSRVPPSTLLDEFLLCRAIALCATKHRRPDLWAARQRALRTVVAAVERGDDVRGRLSTAAVE